MKTQGMSHQLTALRRMNGRKIYALFMEQGTGKTWVFLADAERLYAAGEIDALLIIAPKGVHANWIKREIPKHMNCLHIARTWYSGMGKKARAVCDEVFKIRDDGEQPPLRILAINYDTLNTRDGFIYAKSFLRSFKAMIIGDESSKWRNPKSGRTEAGMALKPFAAYRRIGTGTPVPNGPMGIWAQMEFLEDGLLGCSTYRSFVATYARLIDNDHPMKKKMIQNNPRIAYAQIIERDEETGRPIYRNLDKLSTLLEPHSFRILKKDCLDLPEKIPAKNIYFQLTPPQRKIYKLMEKKFRVELGDKILTVKKLNAITKLQQITSGFVLVDGQPVYVERNNPRLAALIEFDDSQTQPYIIWAQFREELRAAAAALRKAGKRVVEYHGGITSVKLRDKAVDDFQGGRADIFLGQPGAGGLGLTLTAAENVLFMSNGWDAEIRQQAEDRPHRIGLRHPVGYWDIVGENTIDEPIALAFQSKIEVSRAILDPGR
jgi:SNF2 family DNA or RNA helicase